MNICRAELASFPGSPGTRIVYNFNVPVLEQKLVAPLSLEDMNIWTCICAYWELDTAPALIEYTTYTPSVGSVSILRHAVSFV